MENLILVAKVFYVVAAFLMIGAILLQESKGGGLSSLGGTQAESAFGSSNPIRRMTVFLAIIFFGVGASISIMTRNTQLTIEDDEPAPAASADAATGAVVAPTDAAATTPAATVPAVDVPVDTTPPVATPKEPEPVPVEEATPAAPVAPAAPVTE